MEAGPAGDAQHRLRRKPAPVKFLPACPRKNSRGERMAKRKRPGTTENAPRPFEQARDELYSHILRCGVLEAAPEHQADWFDDTMEYLGERYEDLTDQELQQLRQLGERYCRPVIQRTSPVGAGQ
jgi:hypothetical protein